MIKPDPRQVGALIGAHALAQSIPECFSQEEKRRRVLRMFEELKVAFPKGKSK